jgi:hypothetical protein
VSRLIQKHGVPVTIVILAIFGWVIYARLARGGVAAIAVLATTAVIVWALGTCVFIYFWPRITVRGVRRAFAQPVNTLQAMPGSSSDAATSWRPGPMTCSTSAAGWR